MSNRDKQTVAILIPAYNEEEQIATVLGVVSRIDFVDEVLVIDDGSTDRTVEMVRDYPGVKLVGRKVNGGKGAALLTGLEHTEAEIIVSLDADLVGLTAEHVRDLLQPLLDDDQVVMTVGKFKNGRLRTDWAQKVTPFLSGQRGMRRSVLETAEGLSDARYATEVILTRSAKQLGMKVREVILSDASHVMKEEKLGFARGVRARISMYVDILRHLIFYSSST
jgi:glycosyltransferase involved in cell wall biosynthesis